MGLRDLFLTAVVFGSLPFILQRPQIGVLMWVWISVMNPHKLTWGFAYDFHFVAIVAVVTIISALLNKDLKRPPLCLITIAQFSFIVWIGVTTLYALHPTPAFQLWKTLMKTQLLAILIPMLFHRKEDLRNLLWVIVLSIGFYGAKGGVFVLATGGESKVWGPGGYIGDNNAIAAALVMTIPLMRYLQVTTPHRYVRWGLLAMMLLSGVAVLGTYSRGSFIAVCAMAVFLWWKSRQKIPALLIALIAIPFAVSVMPQQWHTRIETIRDWQEVGSATKRLNSWATMLNVAKARPVVGGGFEVATRDVYARYSPNQTFPPQVAHSIYFQALGEHGFVGLGLYLLFLYAIWATASSIIRMTRGRADLAWARELSLMMHVFLVGFGVGGAFLSLVNFDVPYYLAGLMAATLFIVKREIATTPAEETKEVMPTDERVAPHDLRPAHQSHEKAS